MGHYYENTAAGVIPRHFVELSSRPGELRPTTIRDAKKFGWIPSVTTIMGMLDKPALTDWKIGEHLKQAYILHQEGYQADSDKWIEIVKAKTRGELDRAPKDGTDFHDVLENYFNDRPVPDKYAQTCDNVVRELEAVCGEQPWITEKSFISSMRFGGKVDLHSDGWVIDYKTKNTADKWKPGKMAYPEMAMQLAAYGVGLHLHAIGGKRPRYANVFICIETGEVEFYEWPDETLEMEWACFADLLRIWWRRAGYSPKLVSAS